MPGPHLDAAQAKIVAITFLRRELGKREHEEFDERQEYHVKLCRSCRSEVADFEVRLRVNAAEYQSLVLDAEFV